MKLPGGGALAITASLVVAAAIVAGFVLLGSPSEQRAIQLDLRRVSDLNRLENLVQTYFGMTQHLPVSLDELVREFAAQGAERLDPVTGEPYGYRVVDGKHYELCATFDRPALEAPYVNEWLHRAGRRCFIRQVHEPQR